MLRKVYFKRENSVRDEFFVIPVSLSQLMLKSWEFRESCYAFATRGVLRECVEMNVNWLYKHWRLKCPQALREPSNYFSRQQVLE
jgi:hypothetical protein